MKLKLFTYAAFLAVLFQVSAQKQMEKLNRGLVVIDKGSSGVFAAWRMFGTDPEAVTFDLYRNGNKVNASPIATSTNYGFSPSGKSTTDKYQVVAIVNGVAQDSSKVVNPWNTSGSDGGGHTGYYLKIPLSPPAGGTTPDGVAFTYEANDASVGDLDGDGDYEIVLKWHPSNAKDNSQGGYTGNEILEGLEFDGTSLWRIDLGKNIRAGSHYTQFMVYDLDGDGIAEIACKTADGTKDAKGKVIGDASADHRNTSGYILSGPEYFSIFNGQTGEELVTTDYYPQRGNVAAWGDTYGNRVDRFLATIAYLDGQRPSVVMCRGYYTRAALAAYDYRGGELTTRWIFDTNNGFSDYMGQGAHSISVGDVDGDGKDEIMYGAAAIDDNGTGLYTTGMGHGDATHLADIDPDSPGLEFFMPHESSLGTTARPNFSVRNAATGEMKWVHEGGGGDIGRGVTMDIDPDYPGMETWTSDGSGVYDKDGNVITTTYPVGVGGGNTYNFGVWWDADLQREYFDRSIIAKWVPKTFSTDRVISLYNIEGGGSNNGTKYTPCLLGDLLGDWREEVMLRNSESTALILYMNPDVTTHRIRTLMHDPQYRLAIAWQNVGYNQPPHPSFFIGNGMSTPPMPNIAYPDACQATLKSFPFGHHAKADLAALEINLGDLSNVSVPNGSTLMLFEKDGFDGASTIIRGSGGCGVTQPTGTFTSAILIPEVFDNELNYEIRSKANDKLLTVDGASKTVGSAIVVADDNISNEVKGTNQIWSLELFEGSYRMKGFQARAYAQVSAAGLVELGDTDDSGGAKEFEIQLSNTDSRYFSIKSKSNGKCVTLNPSSGALNCQTCADGDANQLFYEQVRFDERVCFDLAFGQYDNASIAAAGVDLADITDLDLPEGTSLILFEGDNYEGANNIIRGKGCGLTTQPSGSYTSAIFADGVLGENIHYILKNGFNKRLVTVQDASKDEGTPVVLDSDEEASHQVWTLTKSGDAYLIRSAGTRGLLEVGADEVLVQGGSTSSGSANEFEIVAANDPTYFALKSKLNGKCIVMASSKGDLQCTECNLADSRQLFFEQVRWTDVLLANGETNSNLQIPYFPNPVESVIYFGAKDIQKVEVVTMTGKLLLAADMQGKTSLNLSGIDGGLYLLRITTREGVSLGKILKK